MFVHSGRSWETLFERPEFAPALSQRGLHIKHLLLRHLPNAPEQIKK